MVIRVAAAAAVIVLVAFQANAAFHQRAAAQAGGHAATLPVHLLAGSSPSAPYTFTISGAATGLFPGATVQLPLTVTNPNPDYIQVTSLTVAVTATDRPGCSIAGRNIQASSYSGPAFLVPRDNGTATVQVPVSMPDTVSNTCRGAQFSLTYGGSATQWAPVVSGDVSCNSVNPPAGSTVNGSVTVDPGVTCTLDGVVVQGNVTVSSGGSLIGIHAVRTFGSVNATGAQAVSLDTGTRIGGALILDSTGGVQVIAAVGGGISIAGTTGASAGSPNVVCASSSRQFQLRTSAPGAPFSIGGMPSCAAGNAASGNMQILNNAGAVTVANNTVGGNLVCTGNTSISAASNSVNGAKTGQCAGTS